MRPSDLDTRLVSELVPYARNSRTHSEAQVAQIAASITEFGFTNPVLIDAEGGIIAGHGRVLAAQSLGLDAVPVLVLDHLTETQRRAYVIADNKLALNAGWDEAVLKAEIETLWSVDFDVSVVGFQPEEIASLSVDPGPLAPVDPGSTYSRKVTAPIYMPKGPAPAVAELFDEAKADALKSEIEAASLPADVTAFLKAAADRHTVFNFHRIADFYANAEPSVQRLMENSALVIIDFDRAIELGFVALSSRLGDLASGVDDEG